LRGKLILKDCQIKKYPISGTLESWGKLGEHHQIVEVGAQIAQF